MAVILEYCVTYNMISDFIIFGTLLVNAAAVLNLQLKKLETDLFSVSPQSTGDKVREFLRNLQYFRIFIAIWNVLVMLLMFVVFGG